LRPIRRSGLFSSAFGFANRVVTCAGACRRLSTTFLGCRRCGRRLAQSLVGFRWRFTEARHKLVICRFQSITFVLIEANAALKTLDCLVLAGEAVCIILSSIGKLSILSLEYNDPILETRVLGPERPAELAAFIHLRARRQSASAAEQ
jgi:hypothetical protein